MFSKMIVPRPVWQWSTITMCRRITVLLDDKKVTIRDLRNHRLTKCGFQAQAPQPAPAWGAAVCDGRQRECAPCWWNVGALTEQTLAGTRTCLGGSCSGKQRANKE